MAGVHASVGLLFEPLTAEFGWSRTEVSAGLSVYSFTVVFMLPFVGALTDRIGARRIVLPGGILTIGAVCLLAMANGSSLQWMLLWALAAVVGSSWHTIVWVHATVRKFEQDRSMALAIVIGGSTFAATIAPVLSQWLTDSFGWRTTFLAFGLGWGGLTWVLALLFLEPEVPTGKERKQGVDHSTAPGLSLREAAASQRLWRIGLSSLILIAISSAFYTHKAPMLVEAGLTRTGAAWLTGLSGATAVSGKLFAGWAMKRWHGGTAGAILIAFSGIPMVFLLDHFATPFLVVTAVMAISFAGGAKVQIGAYLTSQYSGDRYFGTIYGVISSISAVGSALGPIMGGIAYDAVGDYSLFIYIGVPATLISATLLLGLGPYPQWARPAAIPNAG